MTIYSNRNFNSFILIQPQFFCNYPFLYNSPLYLACVAGACKQWQGRTQDFFVCGGKLGFREISDQYSYKKQPSKIRHYVRKKTFSFPGGGNCPLRPPAMYGPEWEKERTGAHEGDTRGMSLLLARPFFLAPTTSKRLLQRATLYSLFSSGGFFVTIK